MSRYSSVNVGALKSHVTTAKRELGTNDFSTIKTNLNKTTTLQSSVNSVIASSLDAMTNSAPTGSIKKIDSYLKNLESACDCIEKIIQLEKEIADLETRKWRTETYTYEDAAGNEHTRTERVLDQAVVNEINQKQRAVSSYEAKTDSYLS